MQSGTATPSRAPWEVRQFWSQSTLAIRRSACRYRSVATSQAACSLSSTPSSRSLCRSCSGRYPRGPLRSSKGGLDRCRSSRHVQSRSRHFRPSRRHPGMPHRGRGWHRRKEMDCRLRQRPRARSRLRQRGCHLRRDCCRPRRSASLRLRCFHQRCLRCCCSRCRRRRSQKKRLERARGNGASCFVSAPRSAQLFRNALCDVRL